MVFMLIHLSDHYVLLVANFIDKKFQYLDNLLYKSKVNIYFEDANFLASAFESYCIQRQHPKCDDIKDFEMEVVRHPSHMYMLGNLDCTIFVMHHIMNYDGTTYLSPNLTKILVRRAIRAQCKAIICLFYYDSVYQSTERTSSLHLTTSELTIKLLLFYT